MGGGGQVANQEKVIASAKISLQEPFDYENEVRLLEAWDRRDYQACLAIDWGPQEPGWGHFYCAFDWLGHHHALESCLFLQ